MIRTTDTGWPGLAVPGLELGGCHGLSGLAPAHKPQCVTYHADTPPAVYAPDPDPGLSQGCRLCGPVLCASLLLA